MSRLVAINAATRENFGKGASRTLRRDGRVPAIIYGKNKETVAISLEAREITKHYLKAGFSSLLMDIEVGGKKYHVLPKKVELHPVTDNIEHVDFLHVADNVEVKVRIHLHFINEDKCIGLKKGGLLNIVARDIDIYALPASIPQKIDVDLANLNIGENIHINNIIFPANVRSATLDANYTIAAVVGKGSEAADEVTAS